MTKLARFTVSCLVATLSLASLRAADAPPPVIERAPESDQTKLQQEIATLRAENQKLAGELHDAQWAAGEAKARLDELTAAKSAETSNASQVAAEKARADEANTRLATLVTGVDKLGEEKAALENRLAAATKTEADLRQQLAVAQKAATPPPPSDTASKLADTETKLSESVRQNSLLKAENELLKNTSADQARLNAEVQTLRQEKVGLEAKVAQMQPPANGSAPAADPAELASRLAQTESKLATALRSYSLLQAETDRLKSASAGQGDKNAELETLRQDKAALEARIAAVPPDQSHHIAAQLADVQDKLSTTLRSYTLLQRENDQLKADASRASSSAHESAAKSAGESATQLSALYDELRQTQAQATALAAENSQLKTRLALVGPPPGSTLSAPSRPGSAQATAATTVSPNPAAETATAPAAPGPRTHVVVLGDSLGKISRIYYGTPSRWEEILRANPDVIKNENVLTVGTTLRIP